MLPAGLTIGQLAKPGGPRAQSIASLQEKCDTARRNYRSKLSIEVFQSIVEAFSKVPVHLLTGSR